MYIIKLTMYNYMVAPFVGAWIEIMTMERLLAQQRVAPFVGAWIEIQV